jgi:hypothetical protein
MAKAKAPLASSSQLKQSHENSEGIELSNFVGEPNTLVKSSLSNSSITCENYENSLAVKELATVEKKSESAEEAPLPSLSETKTVASLERKTQNSLYISRDSKPRVRQGMFSPFLFLCHCFCERMHDVSQ